MTITQRGTALLFIAAGCLTAGCGSEVADTPEKAYEEMSTAFQNREWKTAAARMTNESQDGFAAGLITAATQSSFASEDDDQRVGLTAILKKHGFESLDDDKEADDLPELIADLMNFLTEGVEEGTSDDLLTERELKDVKVTGETATGMVVVRDGDATYETPIEFRRVNGRWYVHFIVFSSDKLPAYQPANS